ANLFKYVEDGGTLIEQYNRPNGLKTEKLAPLDLQISGLRVTDEDAPMTLLVPDHPVLTSRTKLPPPTWTAGCKTAGCIFRPAGMTVSRRSWLVAIRAKPLWTAEFSWPSTAAAISSTHRWRGFANCPPACRGLTGCLRASFLLAKNDFA